MLVLKMQSAATDIITSKINIFLIYHIKKTNSLSHRNLLLEFLKTFIFT